MPRKSSPGQPGRLTSGPSTVPKPAVNTGANYTINQKPRPIVPLSHASVAVSSTHAAGLVQRQTFVHPLKRQGFT